MASLSRSSGCWCLQFADPVGERKTIRLAKVSALSEAKAKALKVKIEGLIANQRTGSGLDPEQSAWAARLKGKLRERLEALGLIPRQKPDVPELALGDFIDRYIANHSAKEGTRKAWRGARGTITSFFGTDRDILAITKGDAADFLSWLKTKDYAEATVTQAIRYAAQFFRYAVDKELLSKNPFTGLKLAAMDNPERAFFVTRDMAAAVLEACPDAEWRLIFALARYGGLRCPSEILKLKWVDIDWARSRFLVHSPKTEHHRGKATRWVPIFPELLPCLQEAFEQAPEGAEYVIVRHRADGSNLARSLASILQRRPGPMAAALLQSPGQQGNRAGRTIPHPRGHSMDR